MRSAMTARRSPGPGSRPGHRAAGRGPGRTASRPAGAGRRRARAPRRAPGRDDQTPPAVTTRSGGVAAAHVGRRRHEAAERGRRRPSAARRRRRRRPPTARCAARASGRAAGAGRQRTVDQTSDAVDQASSGSSGATAGRRHHRQPGVAGTHRRAGPPRPGSRRHARARSPRCAGRGPRPSPARPRRAPAAGRRRATRARAAARPRGRGRRSRRGPDGWHGHRGRSQQDLAGPGVKVPEGGESLGHRRRQHDRDARAGDVAAAATSAVSSRSVTRSSGAGGSPDPTRMASISWSSRSRLIASGSVVSMLARSPANRSGRQRRRARSGALGDRDDGQAAGPPAANLEARDRGQRQTIHTEGGRERAGGLDQASAQEPRPQRRRRRGRAGASPDESPRPADVPDECDRCGGRPVVDREEGARFASHSY